MPLQKFRNLNLDRYREKEEEKVSNENISDFKGHELETEQANIMAVQSVLSDFYMCKMTAFVNGLDLNDQVKENHVMLAARSFSSHPKAFETSLLMKIAPLQVNGIWNSQQSVELRKSFRLKIPVYLDKLSSIYPLHLQDYRIFGKHLISYDKVFDNFLGFQGFCVKKRSRGKQKSTANVSLLVRELKKHGCLIFGVSKGYGKELVADMVIDKFSDVFKDKLPDSKFIEFINNVGNDIFPNNASIAVGFKTPSMAKVFIAGDVYLYSDEVVHVGTEENRVGSNMQRVASKKYGIRVFKLYDLKVYEYNIKSSFTLSTAPLPVNFNITIENILKLSNDDNAVLTFR
jgi:hypothetical protein